MASAHDRVDAAILEIATLRKTLKRAHTPQVHSREERDIAKSTALAWFNNHLPVIRSAVGEEICKPISAQYHDVIAFTDRATTRAKYDSLLKGLSKSLTALRRHAVEVDTTDSSAVAITTDQAPNFSPLIGDAKMQRILADRWNECTCCIGAGAPLAATVMMGGLLETLLLARLNREADKGPIFRAVTAPKNSKTKKVLPLKEWTLRNYLDVAHELNWISKSAKDVGEVLRDSRNYVHPYKQASHDISITSSDANLFWQISKEISRQLLADRKP
jgi:hypothetical protein